MIRLVLPLLLISGCDRMQDRAPEVFEGTDGIMRFVYVGLLLLLVSGGVSISGQGGWLKTLRNIALIGLAFLLSLIHI